MATAPDDPFHLRRFIDAQAPVIDTVRHELDAGRKRTHWMWFVFPQLAGLGRSAMATHYGLSGEDEARAYLAHPVLGPRLVDAVRRLLALPGHLSAHEVMGSPDDLKLHACLTLFARACPHEPVFAQGLSRFFGGRPHPGTTQLLAGAGRGRRRRPPPGRLRSRPR